MTDASKLEDVRPLFELRERNYIITGGAQGIGFACARAICEMGGNVAILDIQSKPVPEFEDLKKFGTKTSYIQTDVTKEESLKSSFEQVLKVLGSVDGCVLAAGIAIDKPFVEQTWDEFNRIQDINVSANVPETLIEFVLNDCAGQRNILHGPALRKTNHQARNRRQLRAPRLSISTYRTSRLQDGSIQRFQRRSHDAIQSSRR
tara:strand:+ start:179 stop:790 length:612 start_codon:yes stop_codon:yes gene_type:complete